MPQDRTQLRRDIVEIPEAVERLLTLGGDIIRKVARSARNVNPPFLLSVARGSSDHACTFLKYASELVLRKPMASAEVLHGPVSIFELGFPVIGFAAGDAAESSLAEVADALASKGARVFAATSKVSHATVLPHVRTAHWLTDPIATIISFYGMVESVALSRGIDPDFPRHLKKVTETV
ncbi:hypothetical protein [Shimia sp.]|uniref:SIS domain-containing protein n=1 Tax=Shimia sp. TaxID=1954381 RepID=UPI0032997DAC